MTMKAFFRKWWCIKRLMPKFCQIIYAAAVFNRNIHTHSHGSEVRWGGGSRQKAPAACSAARETTLKSRIPIWQLRTLSQKQPLQQHPSQAWARGLPSISLNTERCQGSQTFIHSNTTHLFIKRKLFKINIHFLFKVFSRSIFCGI